MRGFWVWLGLGLMVWLGFRVVVVGCCVGSWLLGGVCWVWMVRVLGV